MTDVHTERDPRPGVAVVTGGARGIGATIARRLGELGTTVVAIDAAESDRAGSATDRVIPMLGDVSKRSDIERIVDTVESTIGPIEHLVNAAGVMFTGEAAELSDGDWDATFAVNTTGVFVATTAVLRRMIPRRAGSLVTVSSNAAKTPRVALTAYAASKAASTMFTKCTALEVARFGIRCNVVSPGSTDTDMLRVSWDGHDRSRATIDGDLQRFRLGIPLGRIAQPDDIADAVLFLLSDEAKHITMGDLTVDGGATLGA